MKRKLATTAIAVAGLATAGCFGGLNLDEDQGPQTTRNVSLTGFSAITANGAIDLTVVVGSAETIKIEGPKERVENLKATVEDGTLVLKEESNGLFGNDGRLRVTVTLPALTALGVNGSGDAYVTGVKSDVLSLSINGSADVEVSGEATSVNVTVNGSGDVNARSLKAKKSEVSIAGSGDVEVAASDELSVSVAGSGDVTYYGDPKVTSAVSGSGDVNKG
jgi:hypothetical protein